MSPSEGQPGGAGAGTVALEVDAGNPLVEIHVMDATLRRVGHGVGRFASVALPAGAYKIKFMAGTQVAERLVTLLPGSGTTAVVTRAFRPSAAARRRGADYAASFVAAARRHLPASAPGLGLVVEGPPAAGEFFLQSPDGEPSPLPGRRLGEGDHGGWLGFRAGPAVLSLAPAHAGDAPLQQTIVLCADWHTLVYVPQRGGRPRPGQARMFMDRQAEWPLAVRGWSQTELATAALEQGRPLLTGDGLDELLHADWYNPLLGLLAGHSLLLRPDPDRALVTRIYDHLHGLLGDHPDVLALGLWLEDADALAHDFVTPPMLVTSWRLLCQATLRRPDLVPAESLTAGIAFHLWQDGIWLQWQGVDGLRTSPPAPVGEWGDELLARLRVLAPLAQPPQPQYTELRHALRPSARLVLDWAVGLLAADLLPDEADPSASSVRLGQLAALDDRTLRYLGSESEDDAPAERLLRLAAAMLRVPYGAVQRAAYGLHEALREAEEGTAAGAG